MATVQGGAGGKIRNTIRDGISYMGNNPSDCILLADKLQFLKVRACGHGETGNKRSGEVNG